MSIMNKINLVGKAVKDQLLTVEKILEDNNMENSLEIITDEEILIKYIPPKAIEKRIKIKIKSLNNNWHIILNKE
tara:strand:+ start:89 stop:313 length:225 start_codon:yes stop_codon:yes gene_type:complete